MNNNQPKGANYLLKKATFGLFGGKKKSSKETGSELTRNSAGLSKSKSEGKILNQGKFKFPCQALKTHWLKVLRPTDSLLIGKRRTTQCTRTSYSMRIQGENINTKYSGKKTRKEKISSLMKSSSMRVKRIKISFMLK